MITNEQAKDLLKNLRALENKDVNSMSDKELGCLFLKADEVIKEVEKYRNMIKAVLVAKDIQPIDYPEYGKRVYIHEGKQLSEYNTKNIFASLTAAGKQEEFFKVSSIVEGKLKSLNDSQVSIICAENKEIKIGEKYLFAEKIK